MSPEVFKHLPHLLGKVTAPDQSEFRATPERLAYWDGIAEKLGRPADWRLSNEALEQSRHTVLGQRDGTADLWIFAYGSLMWDPGFHFEEVRLATLDGYRRCFSMRGSIGRGSAQHPALMLSLEECLGRCTGLAFRIAAPLVEQETAIFWRREMIIDSYRPVLLPTTTPQGIVESLVLAANPTHVNYVGELPLEDTARTIASGCGPLGTNLHYLEQLVQKLRQLQIEDDYIDRLERRISEIGQVQT